MKITLTEEEIDKYPKEYDKQLDRDLPEQAGKKFPKALRRINTMRKLENHLIDHMPTAANRGRITLDDLRRVAVWKWRGPRGRNLYSEDKKNEVKKISEIALRAEPDCLRIVALTSLHGVSWPMASAILHFAWPDRYPILDKRAMNAVGQPPQYGLLDWICYTKSCRNAAHEYGMSMRELDRILWIKGGKRKSKSTK